MPNSLPTRLRGLAGVMLWDWLRWRRNLASPDPAYLQIRNRHEQLEAAPNGEGFRCGWRWTSELHAPKFLPHLGVELMRRALAHHPIRRAPSPVSSTAPQVSFVIGHRGVQRLHLLLATLESIAGQEGAAVECVVVEQDVQPQVQTHLPAWVRYVHAPPTDASQPYSRAAAFDQAVPHARSPVLVLHDNDMLVPADYAYQLLERVSEGFEVINAKRFIFYLGEQDTREYLAGRRTLDGMAPEIIVQNLEGGGSVAITRDAFFSIGGFDERFVGWGGEDVEFWDRANTRRTWPYASLPIVHLWHGAQPGKHERGNPNLALCESLLRIEPHERIRELRAKSTAPACEAAPC